MPRRYKSKKRRSHTKKRSHKKNWQQALYQMMGHAWNGEKYILGYKPKTKIKYDVIYNNRSSINYSFSITF